MTFESLSLAYSSQVQEKLARVSAVYHKAVQINISVVALIWM